MLNTVQQGKRKRLLPRTDAGTGGVAGLGRRAAEEHTQSLVVHGVQTVHLQEKERTSNQKPPHTPTPRRASNAQHMPLGLPPTITVSVPVKTKNCQKLNMKKRSNSFLRQNNPKSLS